VTGSHAGLVLVWLVRGCIVALACLAAATDVRRRVVPDWLTLPAMALGLGSFAWRLHWTGAALWALGVAAPALPLLLPWLLGGVGGGDFKLAIAFGALGGPLFGFAALCWGMAAGVLLFAGWGAAAGARAATAGEAGALRGVAAARAGWRAVREDPPPFAVALGTGAVVALVIALRPGI
jgi:Flp pilus assembly protein protease CpaA